jgi:hypothetical protein
MPDFEGVKDEVAQHLLISDRLHKSLTFSIAIIHIAMLKFNKPSDGKFVIVTITKKEFQNAAKKAGILVAEWRFLLAGEAFVQLFNPNHVCGTSFDYAHHIYHVFFDDDLEETMPDEVSRAKKLVRHGKPKA